MVRFRWSETILLAHREILRARSDDRNPQSSRHTPQPFMLGRERGAVVKNYRRAECERAHEPIPHHPTAGSEIENTIIAFDVRVQAVLLEMLKQRAASAVHHAFRKTCSAGRVENVERMSERQSFECQL